jgi:hypothetical protein
LAERNPNRLEPADRAAAEALANLNDHLGRFLQHADALLEDWSRHGAALRSAVDTEVGRLSEAVAEAVESAGERAGAQVGARVEQQVAAAVDRAIERAMADSLGRLRAEVDRLARAAAEATRAGQPAAPRLRDQRPLVAAILSANVMLAILLVLTARDCGRSDRPAGPAPAAIAAPIDAGAALSASPDGAAAVLPDGDGGALPGDGGQGAAAPIPVGPLQATDKPSDAVGPDAGPPPAEKGKPRGKGKKPR